MKTTVVYSTTDDEREATEIAEGLCAARRRASVMRVHQMALMDHPLTPRTTDRFAVLAEAGTHAEPRP